jgi:hypothetical protein
MYSTEISRIFDDEQIIKISFLGCQGYEPFSCFPIPTILLLSYTVFPLTQAYFRPFYIPLGLNSSYLLLFEFSSFFPSVLATISDVDVLTL